MGTNNNISIIQLIKAYSYYVQVKKGGQYSLMQTLPPLRSLKPTSVTYISPSFHSFDQEICVYVGVTVCTPQIMYKGRYGVSLIHG